MKYIYIYIRSLSRDRWFFERVQNSSRMSDPALVSIDHCRVSGIYAATPTRSLIVAREGQLVNREAGVHA